MIRHYIVHRQNLLTLDCEPSIDGVGGIGHQTALREAWDRNPTKPHEILMVEEVKGRAEVNHCLALHEARNEQVRQLRELLAECRTVVQ